MKKFAFILALPLIAYAETPTKADAPKSEDKSTWEKVKDTASDVGQDIKEGTEKAIDQAQVAMATVRDNRAERHLVVTGNYSYIDLIIPSKWGVTLGYVHDAANTFELDYMRGSISTGWLGIDIGSITEQRLSLLWRTYAQRNTFNFQLGVHYNQFKIHIGDELIGRVPGAPAFDYTFMEYQTLGLSWGLGNRWVSKNGFVWGFDWFQIHLPLSTLKQNTPYLDAVSNNEDREDADTAGKIIRHVPRLVALKFQLGFSF